MNVISEKKMSFFLKDTNIINIKNTSFHSQWILRLNQFKDVKYRIGDGRT